MMKTMGLLMVVLYDEVEMTMTGDSCEWIKLMMALYGVEIMIGDSYERTMGPLMMVFYDGVETKMIGDSCEWMGPLMRALYDGVEMKMIGN